jgi:hypothetical protein
LPSLQQVPAPMPMLALLPAAEAIPEPAAPPPAALALAPATLAPGAAADPATLPVCEAGAVLMLLDAAPPLPAAAPGLLPTAELPVLAPLAGAPLGSPDFPATPEAALLLVMVAAPAVIVPGSMSDEPASLLQASTRARSVISRIDVWYRLISLRIAQTATPLSCFRTRARKLSAQLKYDSNLGEGSWEILNAAQRCVDLDCAERLRFPEFVDTPMPLWNHLVPEPPGSQ